VGETDCEDEELGEADNEDVIEDETDSEGETEDEIDCEGEFVVETDIEDETEGEGKDVELGLDDEVTETEGKEEIDTDILEDLVELILSDILGIELGVFELEGLAASLPTVISTPHTSGAFIVSSYLQIVGSLTEEYEKVGAQAT
jgi:hypothetical protein